MATPPALLVTAMDPTTLPVAVGANVAFSVAVCPGTNVVLAPAPLTLNPAPLTITLEIITFAFPLFVSVAPSELLLPTTTLPKSKLLVLEVSSAVAAVELPLVEITSGELGALLVSKIDPVTFPAELGVNITLNVAFWPAAMLIGSVRPDVPKPLPVTLALEIVTLPVPPFCNVIVCEPLAPVVTVGKLALVGIAESCGCGVFVGDGVPAAGVPLLPEELDPITTPAQPFPTSAAANTNATRHFDALFLSDHCPDFSRDPRSDRCSPIVPQV
jgi:hypothetical protein